QNGLVVNESGVSSVTAGNRLRVYIDTASGHDTGIAMANPGDSTVNITLTARQIDGLNIGSSASPISLSLPPRGHTAKFVRELATIWPQGIRGVLEVSASAPISALTMRSLVNQRGDFLLTTFPVADLDLP